MRLFHKLLVQSSVIEGEDYGLNEVFKSIDKGMQALETFAQGIFLGIFLTISLSIFGMALLAVIISFLFMIPFKSKAEKKSFWKTSGIILLVILVVSILIFAIPYAILL
ncbi:hypothetical protein [Terribacillus saccharophilus]|uniref:hypothetical protein n=1 Tax=Terribacillus saccharophilus TaxID=361277 RepID=UPI003982B80C